MTEEKSLYCSRFWAEFLYSLRKKLVAPFLIASKLVQFTDKKGGEIIIRTPIMSPYNVIPLSFTI